MTDVVVTESGYAAVSQASAERDGGPAAANSVITPSGHPKYRPDIDGLRAIAVLSVVLYHAFPARLPGGFTGVDTFFVISGFLISSIIIGQLQAGRFSFIDFYGRRVRRIFPALTVVLVTTYAFGWFSLFAEEFAQLGKHIAAGAGFVSNIVLWNESGYFDAAAERKPLLHLWSLGIEEQFYIVWPLLAWLACKVRLNFAVVIVAVLALSFGLNIALVGTDAVAAFYSPLTRFWELLAGALLAWAALRRSGRLPAGDAQLAASIPAVSPWPNTSLRDGLSVAGLALMGAALLLTTSAARFPGWWALLPTIGTVMLIAAGPHGWVNRVLLSRRLMVGCGLISFPLYLWHWPLLHAARTMVIGLPSASIRLGVVAASIALATLTYQLVEKPIRHGRHRQAMTVALMVIMTLVGGLGFYTFQNDGLGLRYRASPNDLLVREWGLTGAGVSDCGDLLQGTPSAFCATTAAPILAIIGDSHAGALFQGVLNNTTDRDYGHVVMMGAGSCQPTLGAESSPKCDSQLTAAIDRIAQDDKIAAVALAGYAGFLDALSPSEERKFLDGYDRTIRKLIGAGKRVVFVIDNPTHQLSAEYCQPRTLPLRSVVGAVPSVCNRPVPGDIKDRTRYDAFVTKLRASHPQVLFFDSMAVMCRDKICPMFRDGRLLYGDDNHLSIYGSEIVANRLVAFIAAASGAPSKPLQGSPGH